MNIAYKMIVLFLSFSFSFSLDLTKDDFPVQEDGRIKPFSSYSTNQLLKIYNKRSYKNLETKDAVEASSWLYKVITNPGEWIEDPIFNSKKFPLSPWVLIPKPSKIGFNLFLDSITFLL